MKELRKFYIRIILLQFLFAGSEAGGTFLLIPPGAIAQGMGEAMVANSNSALSSYYNPASMSFSEKNKISFSNVKWLPNLATDLDHSFFAFNYKIFDKFAIGGHYIKLFMGEYINSIDQDGNIIKKSELYAVANAISIACKLTSNSSIGINIKSYEQILTNIETKNRAIDLSYFRLGNKVDFGMLLSNMGDPIKAKTCINCFSDPAPTNLRMGILYQPYNIHPHKINLLFDISKLLVTRYSMMDWDGDNKVGGYDKFGNWIGEKDGEFNIHGTKEWDSKHYYYEPWYRAIITSWLDDWHFGGDIDYNHDAIIGGWTWDETLDENSNGKADIDEIIEDENGVYNSGDINGIIKIEKGTGKNRTFIREIKEIIYNMGVEYSYKNKFIIRSGYIYDYKGNVANFTFGFGINYKKISLDYAYTAGNKLDARANTSFFSISYDLPSISIDKKIFHKQYGI